MNRQINATHALPSIHVPTLVIAKEGDLDFPIDQVRDMASRIAGATLVELPGSEHFPWVGDPDAIVDEVERFVVALGEVEAELDRVLATVLFTDVVGSTEKAVRARRSSAGRSWSRNTTGGCAASSRDTAAWRSTRRATGSSPRSTAPPGRSGARGRSSTRSPRSASTSGRACTPARSRRSTARSAGWPW